LPEFFVNATGLNLCWLSFAATELIFIEDHALPIANRFNGDNQTDRDEIGEADEPAAPRKEDVGCDVAIETDISDVLLIDTI
jgi:hypothetical protein